MVLDLRDDLVDELTQSQSTIKQQKTVCKVCDAFQVIAQLLVGTVCSGQKRSSYTLALEV